MPKSVGTKTIIKFSTFRNYPSNAPMKTTVVESYWLHPTKGWRPLERKKTTEAIKDRSFFPRWGVSSSWTPA